MATNTVSNASSTAWSGRGHLAPLFVKLNDQIEGLA